MPLDSISARDVVLPTVVKQLAPAEIVDLSVKEELDHDGDPVLRLLITFRSPGDRLDPGSVAGLIRHLRRALEEHGEERFPHIRFQTEAEAAEDDSEAA